MDVTSPRAPGTHGRHKKGRISQVLPDLWVGHHSALHSTRNGHFDDVFILCGAAGVEPALLRGDVAQGAACYTVRQSDIDVDLPSPALVVLLRCLHTKRYEQHRILLVSPSGSDLARFIVVAYMIAWLEESYDAADDMWYNVSPHAAPAMSDEHAGWLSLWSLGTQLSNIALYAFPERRQRDIDFLHAEEYVWQCVYSHSIESAL